MKKLMIKKTKQKYKCKKRKVLASVKFEGIYDSTYDAK